MVDATRGIMGTCRTTQTLTDFPYWSRRENKSPGWHEKYLGIINYYPIIFASWCRVRGKVVVTSVREVVYRGDQGPSWDRTPGRLEWWHVCKSQADFWPIIEVIREEACNDGGRGTTRWIRVSVRCTQYTGASDRKNAAGTKRITRLYFFYTRFNQNTCPKIRSKTYNMGPGETAFSRHRFVFRRRCNDGPNSNTTADKFNGEFRLVL